MGTLPPEKNEGIKTFGFGAGSGKRSPQKNGDPMSSFKKKDDPMQNYQPTYINDEQMTNAQICLKALKMKKNKTLTEQKKVKELEEMVALNHANSFMKDKYSCVMDTLNKKKLNNLVEKGREGNSDKLFRDSYN